MRTDRAIYVVTNSDIKQAGRLWWKKTVRTEEAGERLFQLEAGSDKKL